jgi:Reverse transcriptase (RNA-dependent DNA polymerase)
MFKADVKDAYYNLLLRKEDRLCLSFSVGGVVYVRAFLKCGLTVSPWFFTKTMRPMVSYLRARGHHVFSYLDDFFGAGSTARNDHPTTEADTARAGRDIRQLFARLGPTLHPTKCDFAGSRSLEIPGILVDTRRAVCSRTPVPIGGTCQRAPSRALPALETRRGWPSSTRGCGCASSSMPFLWWCGQTKWQSWE